MRLDHLLSKEHFTGRVDPVGAGPYQHENGRPVRVAAGCLGGARGWNADQFGGPALAGPLVRHPWWVCGTSGRWGVGTVGTLLGPEGAGDLLSLAQDRPWSHIAGSLWGVRVGWGLPGWWLFVG